MSKTIKEIADELGVSKQRVYRFVKNHCITTASKPHQVIQLSDAVIDKIYQRFGESTASKPHQSDAVSDTLLMQLEIKDSQIKERDEQIRELHQLLNQEQQLNNQLQLENTKLLESPDLSNLTFWERLRGGKSGK